MTYVPTRKRLIFLVIVLDVSSEDRRYARAFDFSADIVRN
jgi:hypothetical protein